MRIRHGIDSIRISRIEASLERSGQAFMDRIWTPAEQAYCLAKNGQGALESLAARFAAKEAVAKALGLGLLRSGIGMRSIEVLLDEWGSPAILLTDGALRRYRELGGLDLAISLTHDGDLAQASCVLLCTGETADGKSSSETVKEADSGEA